jgi:hypothetical protein
LPNQERLRGYVALVLDPLSVERIKALANHSNTHCNHVTMVFRPSPDQMGEFCSSLGRKITVRAVGLARDEQGEALLVEGIQSRNRYPHVTLSCADGVEPKYSNDLIARAIIDKTIEPVNMDISGVVAFVPIFERTKPYEGSATH